MKIFVDRLRERTPAELVDMIARQVIEVEIAKRDLDYMRMVLKEKVEKQNGRSMGNVVGRLHT